MKGYILSESFKDSEIIAGTQAILLENNIFKGIVTVMHLLPSGDWYVLSAFYNGPTSEHYSLHKLIVEDLEHNRYPLIIKQWNSACQLGQVNSKEEIEFEKRVYEFKEGYYEKPCKECESYFSGDKRQSLCQACCNDRTEAKLVSAGTLPKSHKFQIIDDYTKRKEISRIAFEAARENPDQDFENWFNTTH